MLPGTGGSCATIQRHRAETEERPEAAKPPIEHTTGLPCSFVWKSAIARLISSEANTSPPGESTLRITALTLSSSSARFNCALITSTMLKPPWSNAWPVMMPATGTTAILLDAPLSSVLTSSSRGPTVFMRPTFMGPRPVSKCPTLTSMLHPSSTSNMSAKTIQPRPRRRGGVDDGATITGGGVSGGGGGGAAEGAAAGGCVYDGGGAFSSISSAN